LPGFLLHTRVHHWKQEREITLMNFDSLLAQLPNCPNPTTLSATDRPEGFKYIQHGLPEFIGPDVAPSSTIDQPGSPRIMIISAAGAVGKSTLANELAYRKRAPIWDLAQTAAVGGNSLTGQLTASFGFAQAGSVSSKLNSGELFLVVDALDEARVKANEAGFEAFVKNIAEIARDSTDTAFVLLGRTQTAETTWLLLQEVGISTSLLVIQPFTRDQAERYIETRIHHLDSSAAKRIAAHRQPFLEARDLILDQLKRAVVGEASPNDEAAREFLGYAPVLETVAVLLAKEANYQEFTASLKSLCDGSRSNRQTDRPLAVLEHVVTRLLDREQKEKLQKNIKPALEKATAQTGWCAWHTLYSADEQRGRLLSQILGRQFTACPDMPGSVRALYEEQLSIWLPEHPFLREGKQPANKVFESYLFAIAMREYLTPMSGFVEARITAPDYKPTRLLADFYILLGEQRRNEQVAEHQIGFLYDSLLAGETDSLRIRLSIDSGDPEDDDQDAVAEGEFALIYAAAGGADGERIETRSFEIVEEKGRLSFRRQLKEAAIVTRGAVILGGAVDDFEIGPAVDIRCATLQVSSTGFVVRGAAGGQRESDAVVIEALKCESQVSQKPLVRGALSVSWPGAHAYPWNDFATTPADDGIATTEMHDVHRRLRRIVTTLRSHSKGSLARFKDKIEHRRVLGGQMGKLLLETLRKDGILKLDKEFYHWVPDRARELLSVSYHDLRNQRVTPELRAYLTRFIESNPGCF
jgi:hypothetical protein